MNQRQTLLKAISYVSSVHTSVVHRCPHGMSQSVAAGVQSELEKALLALRLVVEQYDQAATKRENGKD